MKKMYYLTSLLMLAFCLLPANAGKHNRYCYSDALLSRQTETIDRGLIAIAISPTESYLSWRLLPEDHNRSAFDVFKKQEDGSFVKINRKSLRKGTNFTDTDYDASQETTYRVVARKSGVSKDIFSEYTLAANTVGENFIRIPLQTLPGHTPGDCSIGDLDGDGQYEIIVKQEMRPRDNSGNGLTGQTKLEAYRLNGEFLWRIDLGKNIREGAHYTQFMVYDFDGDGCAEIICKTADGTVDGLGNVIGDAEADWRERNSHEGHILKGPEYLTVFKGLTGEILTTVPYVPARHSHLEPTEEELTAVWGDGKGNRSDRYLACVAYLDGQRPSVVMCRGYYTRSTLTAWNFRDGKLELLWMFDSDDPAHPENRAFRGQGNHNISVADVDGDGFDEIVYGNMVVDHDGTGMYSTGIGHADAMHLGDLDPDLPGLEVFNTQEPVGDYGMNFRRAVSKEILWNVPTDREAVAKERKQQGPGRAVAFDIDPRYRGSECWVFGGGISGLYSCKGVKISDKTPRSCNFAVWWDADPQRELLDRNMVFKYNWQNDALDTLFVAENCTSNNGTKSTPALSADILGDWREEVILRTRDNKELRIFTTPIPCDTRRTCLMSDPVYRLGIAWQNVTYNIPPHVSYYME